MDEAIRGVVQTACVQTACNSPIQAECEMVEYDEYSGTEPEYEAMVERFEICLEGGIEIPEDIQDPPVKPEVREEWNRLVEACRNAGILVKGCILDDTKGDLMNLTILKWIRSLVESGDIGDALEKIARMEPGWRYTIKTLNIGRYGWEWPKIIAEACSGNEPEVRVYRIEDFNDGERYHYRPFIIFKPAKAQT